MYLRELFPYSFKTLRKEFNIPEPSKLSLVDRCRADDSDFCQIMTAEPYSLTPAQMRHAAERYRLGKSRSGKAIYWMIDELGIVRDGHIGSSWVFVMLKHRYPDFAQYIRPQHCLFGLHLLCHTENTDLENKTICVVESERSAVILSEIYPQNIWMAFAYPANTNEQVLKPLQGHYIVLYPNADETMDTYLTYLEIADQARRKYHLDITVSKILEDRTSPSQKSRHIDLLDYWVENIRNSATIQGE